MTRIGRLRNPTLTKQTAWHALTRQFARTDRVLTGKPVHCQMASSTTFPAWSEGTSIFFSTELTPELSTMDGYAVATGLNYHELGHVLFSPSLTQMRATMPANTLCLLATHLSSGNAGYITAYNILEDQRVETLMVAKYPSMRHYLVATFLAYAIGENKDLGQKFLFSRGRRFLPARLRRMLRRLYVNQANVTVIKRIVDTYRTLNLTRAHDLDTAHQLVAELVTIIGADFPAAPPATHCGHFGVPEPWGNSDTDLNGPEQDRLIRAAQQAADDDPIPGDGATSGDATGAVPGNPDRAADTADSEEDIPPTIEEVRQEADQVRQERDRDVGIRHDLHRLRAVVRDSVRVTDEVTRTAHVQAKPPVHCAKLARDIAAELRRLEEDLDPHWQPRREAGRLNVQRVMRADATTAGLWDEWREGGQGGTDIELVTLLDRSGSMVSQETNLSEAAWIVKRACDLLRIDNTVMLYDDTAPQLFYGPTDRAAHDRYTHIASLGGTAPGSALLNALNILATSTRARRILIVMTDGSWNTGIRQHPVYRNCHDVIGDMNRAGIVTAMVYLGTGDPPSWHECAVRGRITTMAQFPAFVRNLLVKQLRRTR